MKRMKFKLNRKILASIGWLLVITGIIVLMGFIESKQKNIICEKVTVNIDQRVDCFFVEKRGILNMIKKEGIEIIGKPISAIDFLGLRSARRNRPYGSCLMCLEIFISTKKENDYPCQKSIPTECS